MTIVHGKSYGKPTLDLNFAGNKSLIDTITRTNYVTFSRAQSGNEATYVGSDGLIKYASADEPRFDHDPETLESLGLLIEESRTNQIVNSQVFTSGYNQSGLNSITQSTSITTPQGLTDGVGVITESVGGTVHQVYTASTTQVTGYLTYSVFVKPNGRNYCVLCTSSFTHDLINGTTLGSASGEFVSATTVPFPNGWVRCTLTRNHSNTFDQFNLKLATGLNNTSYSGDGTSGVYIWGAQREAGTFPTSYIPTSGSTETRAADEASITGSNFSSWYNQSEGTLYSEINAINTTSQQRILRCKSSSGSGEVALLLGGSTSLPQFYCDSQPGLTNLSYANRTNLKMAGAYKNLDFGFSEGARLLNSNNSWNPPQFTSAEIGNAGGTSQFLTGQIKRLTYFPKRLPDIELQQLTK